MFKYHLVKKTALKTSQHYTYNHLYFIKKLQSHNLF